MPDRKNIERPAKDEVIKTTSFAAYGFVSSDKKVRIAVFDTDNHDTPAGSITLLRRADHDDDGFWSWLVTGLTDRRNYKLDLRNAGNGNLIDSVKFKVALGDKGETITDPGNNATVTPSFTAHGTTDKAALTATMTPQTGNPVSETATVNTSTKSWYAIFYSLTPGNNWALTISTGSATSKPITVKQ